MEKGTKGDCLPARFALVAGGMEGYFYALLPSDSPVDLETS